MKVQTADVLVLVPLPFNIFLFNLSFTFPPQTRRPSLVRAKVGKKWQQSLSIKLYYSNWLDRGLNHLGLIAVWGMGIRWQRALKGKQSNGPLHIVFAAHQCTLFHCTSEPCTEVCVCGEAGRIDTKIQMKSMSSWLKVNDKHISGPNKCNVFFTKCIFCQKNKLWIVNLLLTILTGWLRTLCG